MANFYGEWFSSPMKGEGLYGSTGGRNWLKIRRWFRVCRPVFLSYFHSGEHGLVCTIKNHHPVSHSIALKCFRYRSFLNRFLNLDEDSWNKICHNCWQKKRASEVGNVGHYLTLPYNWDFRTFRKKASTTTTTGTTHDTTAEIWKVTTGCKFVL